VGSCDNVVAWDEYVQVLLGEVSLSKEAVDELNVVIAGSEKE
jgi:hypothetical protein